MAQAPQQTKAEATPAATPAPLAATPVTPVAGAVVPSTLDTVQVTDIGVTPAAIQPTWPGTWPPNPQPPPPTLPDPYSYAVPYRNWVQAMAVRPFVTDPPPCPRPVSRYRSAPITMT